MKEIRKHPKAHSFSFSLIKATTAVRSNRSHHRHLLDDITPVRQLYMGRKGVSQYLPQLSPFFYPRSPQDFLISFSKKKLGFKRQEAATPKVRSSCKITGDATFAPRRWLASRPAISSGVVECTIRACYSVLALGMKPGARTIYLLSSPKTKM